MPAYNCSQFVNQAIDSMLNQTFADFELLVADDCSTDSTKAIIDKYTDTRIKRHHNDSNIGYLLASNKLVKEAKGEFVTFQDADDWSDMNRLQRLVDEFEKNADLGCVGSNVTLVDAAGHELGRTMFKETYSEILNDLPEVFNCVGSALMVKKKVIDEVGMYNLYFNRIGSEDLYWFGLIAKNYQTKNLPLFLYKYRSTPGSISNEAQKPLRKQASKELATHALKYYYRTGKEIFQNAYRLGAIEDFILGKYMCWNGRSREGLLSVLRSIFKLPYYPVGRIGLVRMYLPKAILGK